MCFNPLKVGLGGIAGLAASGAFGEKKKTVNNYYSPAPVTTTSAPTQGGL